MEGFSIVQVFMSLLALMAGAGDIPVALPDETPVMDDRFYAAALESTRIALTNGREEGSVDTVSKDYLEHCMALSYKVMSVLPGAHVSQIERLTFFYRSGERRGFGTGREIMMRCQGMSDEEFIGVFVHEIGHVVDLGLMDGKEEFGRSEFKDGTLPIYQDDLSLSFYRISWSTENELLETMAEVDFVSEYAATDCFEDFGESYAFYVLQGEEFRRLAEANSTLRRKYEFLRNDVFGGQEFAFGQYEADLLGRDYDTTVLPYRLDELLALQR